MIRSSQTGHPRDYAEIKKEGTINVATEYNSISFYVDGDTISGFHYELIEAFAHDKGLKANLYPVYEFRPTPERIKQRHVWRYRQRSFSHQRTERLATPHLSHHTQQTSADTAKESRRRLTL